MINCVIVKRRRFIIGIIYYSKKCQVNTIVCKKKNVMNESLDKYLEGADGLAGD